MKGPNRAPWTTASRLSSAALLLLLAAPTPAHAYLDPGTGSMLIQAALAALFGLGLALRQVRSRLAAAARWLLRSREKG